MRPLANSMWPTAMAITVSSFSTRIPAPTSGIGALMAGVPTTAISRPLAEKLPGPFKGVLQNENKPSQYDPDAPPQFRVVHAVRISNDGLVTSATEPTTEF